MLLLFVTITKAIVRGHFEQTGAYQLVWANNQ